MNINTIVSIAGLGISTFIAGWAIFAFLLRRINVIHAELHRRVEKVKDTYATKDDLDKGLNKIEREMDRLEINMGTMNQSIREGFDRIGSRIDDLVAMFHRQHKD